MGSKMTVKKILEEVKMFGKKVACSFIVFALVFSMTLLPVTAQQNTEKVIYPLTVDSYKQWLATSSETTEISTSSPMVANMAREIINNAEALLTEFKVINNAELLTSFNSLSKESQERFISYLNDEELMSNVFTALIKGTTKPLAGGDITISETKLSSNIIVPGSRNIIQRIVTAHRSAYYYGMLFGQAANTIVFEHDGTNITAYRGHSLFVRVANQDVGNISGTTISEGILNGKAYHLADMVYQFGNNVTYEEWSVWGTATTQGEW